MRKEQVSISQSSCGGGWRGRRQNLSGGEGVDRVKGGWAWTLPPSASWAENTFMTEGTRESGDLQSTCTL
jgi:hypothetical protein